MLRIDLSPKGRGEKEETKVSEIELKQVGKRYGDVTVLSDISLEMADGEFVVLVGPSGCGKSTLLRMIAGLEDITAGQITIGGKIVNNMPAKERDIAMVFQSYALYPHMKVADNMSFSTGCRANSAAGSASAWPWVAPSCAIRGRSSSTSRYRTSTPSCASRCAARLKGCINGWARPWSM